MEKSKKVSNLIIIIGEDRLLSKNEFKIYLK